MPFAPVEKPDDIPVMPGDEKRNIYQMESGGKTVLNVSFVVDAQPEAIIAYYESEMPNYGWTQVTTYADGKNLILYFQKSQRIAMVMITEISGQLTVTISVQGE